MSIRDEARSEADRPTSSNGKWVICGTDWVPEPVYRLLVGLQADREPSDEEVEAAAEAIVEASFGQVLPEAPIDLARAALLAAQEVRRG